MTDRLATGLGFLDQASKAAHAVHAQAERAALLEDVAMAYVAQGHPEPVAQVLESISCPVARVRVNIALGQATDDPHPLAQAEKELSRVTEWAPRQDLPSLAHAQSALSMAWADHGDPKAARRVIAPVTTGPAAVRAWCRLKAWAEAEQAAVDTEDRKAARVAWTALVSHRGEVDVEWARSLATRLLAGEVANEAPERVSLTNELACALARADHREDAVWVWDRAIEQALALRANPRTAVIRLVEITISQLELLSLSAASRALQLAIDLLEDEPLPAEESLRFPWHAVMRCVRQHSTLSEPLRLALRRRDALPAQWSYLLGRLELRRDDVPFALKVATVLQDSFDPMEEDAEPLWLAGLLCARAGERQRAHAVLGRLLDELGEDVVVSVPWETHRDLLLETHFANAFVVAGHRADAVGVARTVSKADQRAMVLVDLAEEYRLAGETAVASTLAREALGSLVEAAAKTPGSAYVVGVLPSLVAGTQWAMGETTLARDTARRICRWCLVFGEELAVPLLADLARSLLDRQLPELAEQLLDELQRRVDGISVDALRTEALLDAAAILNPSDGP